MIGGYKKKYGLMLMRLSISPGLESAPGRDGPTDRHTEFT